MHMQVPWNMQAHAIPGHGSVTKHGVVDQADMTLEGWLLFPIYTGLSFFLRAS